MPAKSTRYFITAVVSCAAVLADRVNGASTTAERGEIVDLLQTALMSADPATVLLLQAHLAKMMPEYELGCQFINDATIAAELDQ